MDSLTVDEQMQVSYSISTGRQCDDVMCMCTNWYTYFIGTYIMDLSVQSSRALLSLV